MRFSSHGPDCFLFPIRRFSCFSIHCCHFLSAWSCFLPPPCAPAPLHHGLFYHAFLARLIFNCSRPTVPCSTSVHFPKREPRLAPRNPESQLEATAFMKVFYHSSHLSWDSFLSCLRFPGSLPLFLCLSSFWIAACTEQNPGAQMFDSADSWTPRPFHLTVWFLWQHPHWDSLLRDSLLECLWSQSHNLPFTGHSDS